MIDREVAMHWDWWVLGMRALTAGLARIANSGAPIAPEQVGNLRHQLDRLHEVLKQVEARNPSPTSDPRKAA